MANQANLEATLAAIEANPDHWVQGAWHCGTSHCFAGFAQCLRRGVDPLTTNCDSWRDPSNKTRQWLGLTARQWEDIINYDNTLDELRDYVKQFCKD
jgi:hypothetical protein